MFTLEFIILLIISFCGYYIVPAKYRYIWLLIVSYYFYASQSAGYVGIMIVITLITFFSARSISKQRNKAALLSGIILPAFTLLLFKYINAFSAYFHIKNIFNQDSDAFLSIIAPIGISFYTLVAIGYVVDVYKGKVEAEHNILRYASFVSFFPTILSGPIERSTNLLAQLKQDISFSYDKVRRGCLYILCGYCMKLLLANRLSVIVDTAFSSYELQTGATMLFALVLYGVELYVDFASYSIIVIGIGNLFGFSILENFRQPYLSGSISDFWNRWHISLSSWLRDYIYIPLGGNRRGKIRKYLNLMITFLVSGIWHGNGWRYIIWGLLHGVYQVVADIIRPVKVKFLSITRIKKDCFSFRLFESIITFILVDFAWLFFRAPSAREAFIILKNIISNFSLGETVSDKLYLLGCEQDLFSILVIFILILFAIDIVKEMKVDIFDWLFSQNKVFRWIVYIILCVALVIGLIYDYGIEASSFIYTKF